MTLHTHTIELSLVDLALWHEGGVQGFAVEEDCLDLLNKYRITHPVVVLDPAGRVLFGISPGERRA